MSAQGPRAYVLVRSMPGYPWQAIHAGLRRCGLSVVDNRVPDADFDPAHDWIVTWTPWEDSLSGTMLKLHPQRTIVLENGYLPVDDRFTRYYLMGVGGFHSFRHHPWALMPDMERLARFWPSRDLSDRKREGRVMVFGQRGAQDVRWSSPIGWGIKEAQRLSKMGNDVVFRPPPARADRWFPLGDVRLSKEPDLLEAVGNSGAGHFVTWNSKVAVALLMSGINVYCAGTSITAEIGEDRNEFLGRIVCCQWTEDEFASGDPFRGIVR